MTNHWVDIKNADVVLIMGGNAAEAHPCGFKWVTEAKAHNKARLIVVDPRFTRSASVADYYAPIRTGTDIAFLGGVINYLLSERQDPARVRQQLHRRAVHRREDYAFKDGIFTGYDADKRSYDNASLGLRARRRRLRQGRPDAAASALRLQLMKQHYARYTPEMVEQICGTPKDKFLQGLRDASPSTAVPDARDDDPVRARLDAALESARR